MKARWTVAGLLDMDDHVRPGYQGIRVSFRIKADAPRETLEELVRFARTQSLVADTVSNPVRADVRLAG